MSTVISTNALTETVKPRFYLDTSDIHLCAKIPVSGSDNHYYSPEGTQKIIGLLFYTGNSVTPTTRTLLRDERYFLEGHLIDITEFFDLTSEVDEFFGLSVVFDYFGVLYEIPVTLEIVSSSGTVTKTAFANIPQITFPTEYNFINEVQIFNGTTLVSFNDGSGVVFTPSEITSMILRATVEIPQLEAYPDPVVETLVGVDVSTDDSVSPMDIIRAGGDWSFQLKSLGGADITVVSITDPDGVLVGPARPFTVNATPVTVDCNSFSPATLTINHNGSNSPFVVNADVSS